ncbi:MAG: glycosyltransferase family 39 protein, partial [Bacteroidales bacterium]|nr:glycosyltransferase family 39 protein [Bacteroidales bacterium]
FNKKSFFVWLSYVAVLLTMSYFAYFYKLGSKTLHIWDESRYAVNAYEVGKNGKYLTPTYDGQIDMWNTKPPFLIGCQAICIKVFGNNESSVRLPSAAAASLAVLVLFFVVAALTKSKPLGFLVAGIFLTTPGLLPYHALRQADFESFLLFFSAAYSLVFLYYIETKKTGSLYLAMALFTLAFLSKSSASLFFLPGIMIYVLMKRETLHLLKFKHFYFSLLIPIIVLSAYYFGRELINPGYLKAVYLNEFGGRAFTSLEGHSKPFLFYYTYLSEYALGFWYMLIPAGLVLTFFEKNKQVRNLFVFSLLLALTHLLLISVTKTKLEWYCLPEVPFWALLSGISIYQIASLILKLVKKPQVKEIILILAFAGVLYYPAVSQFKLVKFLSVEESWQQNVKLFLRDRVELLITDKSKEIIVISDNYDQNTRYYIYKLRDKGYTINNGSFGNVKNNTYVVLDIIDENKMIEAYSFVADVDTVEIFTERVKAFYIGDYYTKEESLNYVQNLIISNAEFKKYIEEKAETNDVSFERQLSDDANYLIENAKIKLGIPL